MAIRAWSLMAASSSAHPFSDLLTIHTLTNRCDSCALCFDQTHWLTKCPLLLKIEKYGHKTLNLRTPEAKKKRSAVRASSAQKLLLGGVPIAIKETIDSLEFRVIDVVIKTGPINKANKGATQVKLTERHCTVAAEDASGTVRQR